jgi:hypothetical protein
MLKLVLAFAGPALAILAAPLASAETYETPFGDVTADQSFSLSEPSYRYELSYTDPTGTFTTGGWSEGRPDYGLHSDIRTSVNGVEIGNHQHYGYEGSLIENNFDLGDVRTEQKLGGEGYQGAVFYQGRCIYGCVD